jgi:hypothetical protein
MTPLFALEPFSVHQDERAAREPATPTPPCLISYRIIGVFRTSAGEEHERTVQGHSISTRLRADIATFIAYLSDAGWLFEDGRSVLVALHRVESEHDACGATCMIP